MKIDLTKKLKDPDNAAALVDLLFHHVMAEPVDSLVDADVVLAHLDRAMDERITDRWVREHLTTFLERESARAEVRQDTVGDWLAAELQAELRALSMRPVQFNRRFLREVVQQDSVKHMVKKIVEETLNRFVTTLKPGGSGGGLIGSVGRGAFGFASRASKGILGQIGGQLESQLQSAATSFVQNSTAVMLDRIIVILTSPETAQHLGRSGAAAHDAIMKQKTSDVWRFVEKNLPLDDLLECLPGQCLHIMSRDDLRQGIRDEVAAFLAIEGKKKIGDLFADHDQMKTMNEEVVALATPLLMSFAQSDAFKTWSKG